MSIENTLLDIPAFRAQYELQDQNQYNKIKIIHLVNKKIRIL